MREICLTGFISLVCWIWFQFSFRRDRSRYRNCYYLFIALLSVIPFFISVGGPNANLVIFIMICVMMLGVLVVPFFLIYNGIVMIRKEGRQIAHMLSLAFGIAILIGETAFFAVVAAYTFTPGPVVGKSFYHSWTFIAGTLISVTVIYGSMSFLIFMIYTWFLQIIPRKKDFDYVIIHGAGLIGGEKISKLLQDRLDKAIDVYRKDPTHPKLIPSGGKGSDESISEAEAMKRYLVSQGILQTDILPEDTSKTTFENLKNSKEIIDRAGGGKYTALVTSNYHVYRALRYCRKIGLSCTGIGSHVAFYYWPSAMIREFIAIHMEKKHAVIFVAGWLISIVSILMVFL